MPSTEDDERTALVQAFIDAFRLNPPPLTLRETATVDLDAFAKSISNARVFTRQLLQDVAAAVQQASDPSNTSKIYLKDVHGVDRVIWDPTNRDLFFQSCSEENCGGSQCRREEEYGPLILARPKWNNYFSMAYEGDAFERHGHEAQWLRNMNRQEDCHALPVFLIPCADRKTDSLPTSAYESVAKSWTDQEYPPPPRLREMFVTEVTLQDRIMDWKLSENHAFLTSILRKNAVHTRRIKKIVCFGLGTLGNGQAPFKMGFGQHLCAITIAQTLQELYSQLDQRSIPVIPIYVQDPLYRPEDERIFSKLGHPLTIVKDPHGFLEVDEHSLVMSAYVRDITSIVADVVYPKTPAALFMNSVYLANGYDTTVRSTSEWGQECGKSKFIDYSTPRAVDMLKGGVGVRFLKFGQTYDIAHWMDTMQLWLLPKEEEEETKIELQES